MTTISFKNVYVKSRATSVGPTEMQGPLANYFDNSFKDNYINSSTFEKGERNLVKSSVDVALNKAHLLLKDIDLCIGSDLNNQIACSNYYATTIDTPFIGVYGACSNSALTIGTSSCFVDKLGMTNVLCFTSSSNAVAEKQFRYPNEYGVQKKETTTYTVTGAGAIVLSKDKSNIKVTSFTIGKVIDWEFKDLNDMGKAMAPSAYETLTTHLSDLNRTIDDYDLIVTGDLSSIGLSFLKDLLSKDYKNHGTLDKINDCGLLIYNINKQNVFCGGSGCGCSMCVTLAFLLKQIEDKLYKRILLVATGALLSPIECQQKESIPCCSHAIVFEGTL
ncbi:MAG: stage V sporulation protein AD [Erysipelotrichaceae bacterium]